MPPALKFAFDMPGADANRFGLAARPELESPACAGLSVAGL